MNLLKRADVKNHLSARHRTEIHLNQQKGAPDSTLVLNEEFSGEGSKVNNT